MNRIMSKTRFFFLVTILFGSWFINQGSASQDNDYSWSFLGRGEDKSKFEISMINHDNSTAQIRRTVKGYTPHSSVGLWQFDCERKSMFVVHYILFAKDGSILAQGGPTDEGPVENGTMADEALKRVCIDKQTRQRVK